MCLLLSGALACVAPNERIIFGCIAGSAALLAIVHHFAEVIQVDTRTALADLVLLTPAFALLSQA